MYYFYLDLLVRQNYFTEVNSFESFLSILLQSVKAVADLAKFSLIYYEAKWEV